MVQAPIAITFSRYLSSPHDVYVKVKVGTWRLHHFRSLDGNKLYSCDLGVVGFNAFVTNLPLFPPVHPYIIGT
jgi:hypothetical protein